MKQRSAFVKDVKLRFKFIAGNEFKFAIAGLILALALFIVLASVAFSYITEKIRLEMKFESEKSFNSIYMALVDNPSQAEQEMKAEGVSAVGIYSSNGRLYMGLGDIPSFLQLGSKPNGLKDNDSTLGVYYYNENTKEIEYFRLSRLNVALETGFSLDSPVMEIPEIVYIKFDGSRFFSQLVRAEWVFFLSITAILAIFILVLVVYTNNRKYRMQIAKNENLAQLGAAARTLTHEIKNPLSVLTIQTALMKKTLPEEYSEDMDIIDHELTRLSNLTDRVSEFLKNPLGAPEKIELVGFIKDIAKLFSQKIPVLSDVDETYVMFDADRARSVFENLLKNACESVSDGRNPEVEVEIRSKKKFTSVEIRDRGEGISQEVRSKLFDPFFSTKIHGSGIGLSITSKFVKAVGGSLEIEDRDGGGTVVTVVLPCCRENENENSDS